MTCLKKSRKINSLQFQIASPLFIETLRGVKGKFIASTSKEIKLINVFLKRGNYI